VSDKQIDSAYGRMTFSRLKPDVTNCYYCFYQFSGERQRETPVATVVNLQIILMQIPGRNADKYREISANIMTRILAGDLSLIGIIQKNHSSTDDINNIARDYYKYNKIINKTDKECIYGVICNKPINTPVWMDENDNKMDLSKNMIKIGKSCNSDRTNEYKNMEVLFIIPMPNEAANKFEDVYKSLIPKEYKYRNEYYYIFNHVIDLQVNPDEFLSNFIYNLFSNFIKINPILTSQIVYINEKIGIISKLFVEQVITDDIESVRKRLEIQKLNDDYNIELESKKKTIEIELEIELESKKSKQKRIDETLDKLYEKLLNSNCEEETDNILKIIDKLQNL
jgi:hypothetical protein